MRARREIEKKKLGDELTTFRMGSANSGKTVGDAQWTTKTTNDDWNKKKKKEEIKSIVETALLQND